MPYNFQNMVVILSKRTQILCNGNRITRDLKTGNQWAIPKDEQKQHNEARVKT